MPSFKKKEVPVTPGVKLFPSDIEKLKYICEQFNTSQSKLIQYWIRNEYKRLKKVEKQGYEII
jgi:hypothetical protein